MRDLSYAIRSLARSPGFTVAAILTLAIGFGAATTIYSIVNTILLEPLPFPDSDRFVRLLENFPTNVPTRPISQRGLTFVEFLDWRARMKTLDHVTAIIGMSQRMVKTPDGAAGLWGAMTSPETFQLLRVKPFLGRTLLPEDTANPDVVVLSHDVWRTYYHADRNIIGTALELRTGALLAPVPPRLLTVVGVLPPDFEFPTQRYDFLTPVALNPTAPRSPQVTTMARLADGVPLEAAIEEANAMGNAIRPPWPAAGPQLDGRSRFELEGLKARIVEPVRPAFRILIAAVVVVLLIVCANVANLMLARGAAREREIAVRLAVGAGRGHIIRQVLGEAVVLAVAGGVLGALFAVAGVSLVKQLATVEAPGIFRLMFGASILPRANEITVDVTLLGIAFSIAAVACLAFGSLPALQLSRTSHLHSMGARGSSAGRTASRMRTALTVAQVTLATVLLAGAGLLIHSFARLSAFDKGYNPANVLAFNLLFPDQYSTVRKGETIETLLHRFRANPAVRAAGFARHGLLIGEELYLGTFVPPGKIVKEMRGVRTRSVSDGYLTAMAVPVLDGRELLPSDSADAPPVIVINRTAARQYFGDARAVGQTMDWDVGKSRAQVTIVGVVEDVRQEGATDPIVPEIFVDYRQYLKLVDVDAPQRQNEAAIGFLSFALRTAREPEVLIPAVREVVRAVDPNIGIDAILPMERLEASSRARERFYAVVLGMFAAVATLLGAIGVYGVLAYAVEQRTREIGVRMAIGAERRQVLGLIMRRGLTLALAGIVAGLAVAAASARSLESLLFGVAPLDAATFAAVAAGFTIVSAAASYLPARRATKIDPAVTLRYE